MSIDFVLNLHILLIKQIVKVLQLYINYIYIHNPTFLTDQRRANTIIPIHFKF